MSDFNLGDAVSINQPLIKASGRIEADKHGKWIVVFPYEPTKYSNGESQHVARFKMVRDYLDLIVVQ